MNSFVIGVDIGGSHITAAVIDIINKVIVPNTLIRTDVNSNLDSGTIISIWSDVIRTANSHKHFNNYIGIAMPGPFDYVEGICKIKDQNKYRSLYDLNIKELLAKNLKINSKKINFLNDAVSFLRGEVFMGAAKDASNAIGVTLGTGLGSARYQNGLVEDADLWNTSFLNGIAEDYLSTRWFVSKFYSLTGEKIKGVKELAAIAPKNSAAQETFQEFGYNLSLFLLQLIKKDNPETIVIGGNIAKSFPLFEEELFKQLEHLPTKPSINKAKLGEESSLIGAASCWIKLEEELIDEIN